MDAHALYAHQNGAQPTTLRSQESPPALSNTTSSIASSHTLFFYGTLMAPPVLKRVIHGPDLKDSTTRTLPSTLTSTPAILPDFRRHRVRCADYPAIVPSATGNTVRGTLVSGLNDGDVWRLDIFEGAEYTRSAVRARPIVSATAAGDLSTEPSESDLGLAVPCETYIWQAPVSQLEESAWDFEEFMREKMWRWAGEKAGEEGEYKEVDEAISRQDEVDPMRGRNVNGAIGKALEESRGKERELLESAV